MTKIVTSAQFIQPYTGGVHCEPETDECISDINENWGFDILSEDAPGLGYGEAIIAVRIPGNNHHYLASLGWSN